MAPRARIPSEAPFTDDIFFSEKKTKNDHNRGFKQVSRQFASSASLFSFREDMRNSFNFLLIALICMDSSYLIGWIIEAFRKSFQGRNRSLRRIAP